MKGETIGPTGKEALKRMRRYRANGYKLIPSLHLRTNAAWRARKRKDREMRRKRRVRG